MGYLFQHLDREPIILVTFTQPITVQDVRAMYADTAQVARALNTVVYRITDMCAIQLSVQEISALLQEGRTGAPGSSLDPCVKSVLVSRRNRTRFLVDLVRLPAFGGLHVPAFDSVPEALAHIREQLPKTACAAAESST